MNAAARLAGVLLALASCAACARPKGGARETTAASAAPAASALATDASVEGAPCGGAGCRRFSTAALALRAVLDENPRVLAVGEAHAQKGTRVRSATARFTRELLPLLRGKAAHLVLEIWLQTGKCGQVERRVREQQQPVVTSQAPQNLDEFVALGARAKALGIAPQALVPSCGEYDAISKAGADDIARMLEMITARTERDIVRLLEAQERDAGKPGLIVAYGGGLHNDVEPRAGREAWSFGPALTRRTAGRYVELDLIVPELVKDSEAWRAQRWYAHYDAAQAGASALLYNPAPRSYALILPRE